MKKFTIQCNYNASITLDVFAEDEDSAMRKALDIAEDADINEFTICGEREHQVLSRG